LGSKYAALPATIRVPAGASVWPVAAPKSSCS